MLMKTASQSLTEQLSARFAERIRSRLLKTLNLRTLYVHHRLVIMRLES